MVAGDGDEHFDQRESLGDCGNFLTYIPQWNGKVLCGT